MKKIISVFVCALLLCSMLPVTVATSGIELNYSVSSLQIMVDDKGEAEIEIVAEGSLTYAGMQFELISGPGTVLALNAQEAQAENAVYLKSVEYNQGSRMNYSAPQHSSDRASVFFHVVDTGRNSFFGDLICSIKIEYTGSTNVSLVIKQIKQVVIFGTGDINETVSGDSLTIAIAPYGGDTVSPVEPPTGPQPDGGYGGSTDAGDSGLSNIDDNETPLSQNPLVLLTDIDGHWAYELIMRAVELGFVDGMPDGTFQPNAKVTRAQCVKMIVAAFELTTDSPKQFSDTRDHWASEYIGIAAANGIILGVGNDRFAPESLVTRQDMAVIIMRVCDFLEITLPETDEAEVFSDNEEIRGYAKAAVTLLQRAAILQGSAGVFRPLDNASRAECVKVIVMTLEAVQ